MNSSASLLSKDNCTGGHGRGVAHDARLIGVGMGLPGAEVDAVSEAVLLHDRGRTGIPDRVLRKPDRLVCRHGIGAVPALNLSVHAARSRYHLAIVAEIMQSLIGNALLAVHGETS